MLVCAAQIDIEWENQEANMIKCERFIKEASKQGSRIVLFPEMCLTGFTMNISCLIFKEEDILEWLKNIAQKYRINIGMGFAVKKDDKGRNEYVIVSCDGSVLSRYIKIHPFSYGEEDKTYEKGNEISHCSIEEADISTFICYDLRFPEIFQIASKKSNFITIGANWPDERIEHWYALLKARAIENQCYIAGINRCGNGNGLDYTGGSVFIGPDGKLINEPSDGEKLITADIDFTKVNNIRGSFNIKNDRREELYYNMFNFIKS